MQVNGAFCGAQRQQTSWFSERIWLLRSITLLTPLTDGCPCYAPQWGGKLGYNSILTYNRNNKTNERRISHSCGFPSSQETLSTPHSSGPSCFERCELFNFHVLLVKPELCWSFHLFAHRGVNEPANVPWHAYPTDAFKSTSSANSSTNSACSLSGCSAFSEALGKGLCVKRKSPL